MRLVFEALVVNLALILSFVYVVNRFKPWSLTPLSPLRERLLHGVGFGVLSGLIMEFSLVLGKVDYRYMPDYRYVPVIASGLLGGPAPALVAGLINSLWRLYMIGGEGMWIGVATSLMIGFLAALDWPGGSGFCDDRLQRAVAGGRGAAMVHRPAVLCARLSGGRTLHHAGH